MLFPPLFTQETERLVQLLQRHAFRLVLAESCTGGLVASRLTETPGISEYFCGSAVVYRDRTKLEWLGVPGKWFRDEAIGAVSPEVAVDMAAGVLNATSEAHLAASITGHLGPDAPQDQDGLTFLGIASRIPENEGTWALEQWLTSSENDKIAELTDTPLRERRQTEAAYWLVLRVAEWIEDRFSG